MSSVEGTPDAAEWELPPQADPHLIRRAAEWRGHLRNSRTAVVVASRELSRIAIEAAGDTPPVQQLVFDLS